MLVVVQSTDKNFLVPVGGAVVFSSDCNFLNNLSQCYPGRASMSPVLDVFITLLSLGEIGFQNLLRERERLIPLFRAGLKIIADKYELQVLSSTGNTISTSVFLDALHIPNDETRKMTFLGSMLFLRNVSGCRVVVCNDEVTSISGFRFKNWGSHTDNFSHDYFTAACAVGQTEAEVLIFLERLNKVMGKFVGKK